MHAQLLHSCRREGPGSGEAGSRRARPCQLLGQHPEVTTARGPWEPPPPPCWQEGSAAKGHVTATAEPNLSRGTPPALTGGKGLALSPPRVRQGDGLPQAQVPLKVFPQIWQKWGRPSWWRLATCLSRGPFSVKRCSQNSQLKGLSPVWVRLCLSRLAVGTRSGAQPPGLSPSLGRGRPASPWVRKVLPQRWHWKGFSPVCVRRCMLRLAFWVKAWLQNSQTYGRSFLSRRGHRHHRKKQSPPEAAGNTPDPRAKDTGQAEASLPEL